MNDDVDAEIGREVEAGKVGMWLLLGLLLGALVLAASVALWRDARERGRVAGYSEGWQAGRAMAQLDLEGQAEREKRDAADILDCRAQLAMAMDGAVVVKCPLGIVDLDEQFQEGLDKGLRLGREDWKARGFDCLGRARAAR